MILLFAVLLLIHTGSYILISIKCDQNFEPKFNSWLTIWILAPKLPARQEQDMLKKKTYGRVPKYVTKIK